MLTLDIDPQTTVMAPRPMPDEVVILTCDADGARGWLKMSKVLFAEVAGEGWSAILADGVARLYEQEGGPPNADWVLAPETLNAREDAMAKYLADPANIRPGDTVTYKDPRQQPGVPRSDDVQ